MIIRPSFQTPSAPTTERCTPVKEWGEIEELCELCRAGKLYQVEEWISAGKPIQCEPPKDRKLQKRGTPLQLAVALGFYSLAELLLVNGYDPNGDYFECLSPAVRSRNHSMLDLLLRHGANPIDVIFETVLETYDRRIMDTFIAAGADPCSDHSVARVLRYKKRPHLGFVKSYSEQFPGLIRQVTIALLEFINKNDFKGVSMMMWLGADPSMEVPEAEWEGPSTPEYHECPLVAASWRNYSQIVKLLLKAPIPPDKVQSLFCRTAHSGNVQITRRLLELGANPNDFNEDRHVLEDMISHATCRFGVSRDGSMVQSAIETIRVTSQAGAKLEIDEARIAQLRRRILQGTSEVACAVVQILREHQVLTEEQLHELTRTAGMKRILDGDKKPIRNCWTANHRRTVAVSPPQSPRLGYWKRHWSQL
jgi:hypothetical protein